MELSLSLGDVDSSMRDVAAYAAAALHALGREESRGRRPRRLLEENLATWQQFRGHLDEGDFLRLLIEDAAVTQPSAFQTPPGIDARKLERLPQPLLRQWLAAICSAYAPSTGSPPSLPNAATSPSAAGADAAERESSAEYVAAQAQRLGIGARMARSKLHKLAPHNRALELPGSGGQLAHHIVSRQDGIHLRDVFTIACQDWRDYTLAALVAVELGLSGPAPIVLDPELSQIRGRAAEIDYVLGLDPDKGGRFTEERLKALFPNATIVLV